MSEAIGRYFSELLERLEELSHDEMPSLDAAADACAETMANGGAIHIHDTGHLISHEMITRTGGLVAYRPLTYGGNLENNNLHTGAVPSGPTTMEEKLAAERSLLDWVFAQGRLQPGDVLIVGSVSGTGWKPVELVLQARARGLTTIAISAPEHSSRLEPSHPSGKRLYEAADIVLDNHAEYGDSFFEIDGLNGKVAPLSGLGAALLMWALTVGIVDRLVKRGLEPSIYTSINLPGGPAAVEAVERAYKEKGY